MENHAPPVDDDEQAPPVLNRAYKAELVADIPPLAWLWDSSAGDGTLLHGSRVFLFGDGFFEGAWDGNFAEREYDTAVNVYGSGAKWRDGTVRFVTPSHTLEALYYVAEGHSVVVSNSLIFILTYSGLELRHDDWSYGGRFAAIARGTSKSPLQIPLNRGQLNVLYHHNLAVGASDAVEIQPKALPPRFGDFHDYAGYLERTVGAVFDNAQHPARYSRYEPLTTLSSGYDSATCATLAAKNGCKRAVGIVTSQRGLTDSGANVAAALGLEFKAYERPNYEEMLDDNALDQNQGEAEFLCVGLQGEDSVYGAFADAVGGSVLLTGFMGTNWETGRRNKLPPNDGTIAKTDLSGGSLGEFRLQRDFIHLVVPFIGAQRFQDVARITASEEMRDYSVGGAYDKPIPRRIVESAGVKREDFGSEKRAVSIVYFDDKASLSKATRDDIEGFRRDHPLSAAATNRYQARVRRWQRGSRSFYLIKRLKNINRLRKYWWGRALQRLGLVAERLCIATFDYTAVFEHTHPRSTLWQVWAIRKMQPRYAAALTRRAEAGEDQAVAAAAQGSPQSRVA